MINLYLLRHGKTLGPPALNGSTDAAVDEATIGDMARCLQKTCQFRQIVCSSSNLARLLDEQTPGGFVA